MDSTYAKGLQNVLCILLWYNTVSSRTYKKSMCVKSDWWRWRQNTYGL